MKWDVKREGIEGVTFEIDGLKIDFSIDRFEPYEEWEDGKWCDIWFEIDDGTEKEIIGGEEICAFEVVTIRDFIKDVLENKDPGYEFKTIEPYYIVRKSGKEPCAIEWVVPRRYPTDEYYYSNERRILVFRNNDLERLYEYINQIVGEECGKGNEFDMNEIIDGSGIQFYEAATVIKFFRENVELFRDKKITGFYIPGPPVWYESAPKGTSFETDYPFIIEFETYVVLINYGFYSDMRMRFVNKKDFDKGELTLELVGRMEDSPQPFENLDILGARDSSLVEVIVERFSEGFDSDFARDYIRPDGGDYFAAIYFMTEKNGLMICAQDAISDGWMTFKTVDWIDIDRLEDNSEYTYERIKIQ